MVLAPELATARSSLPSLLKLPTATDRGVMPTATVGAGWKVPSPLPRSTETVLDPELATARSSLPSPLKSPTATEVGLVPTAKVRAAWKVPSPLPNSTETVLLTGLQQF